MTEEDMPEEKVKDIRVVMYDYPARVFLKSEYYVAPNGTLVITPHLTLKQYAELKNSGGYIQAVATYNQNTWIWVEVMEP